MVVKKGRSVTAEVKINLAAEGGRIDWSEEVEREDPPKWWSTYEAKQKQPQGVKKEVKKEVRIRKETTYPYYMPVGSYLAMKLGEKGTDKRLEAKFMAQIKREPGVCKGPQNPQFRNFDVEKLDDVALQRLIRGCESGLEIVHVGEVGRTQPCVVMHAMGPHSSQIIIPATTKEQTSQDTGRGQFRGVEEEVIDQ